MAGEIVPDFPITRFIYVFNTATADTQLRSLLSQYGLVVANNQPIGENNAYRQYQVTALQSDIDDIVAQAQVRFGLRIFYSNVAQIPDYLGQVPIQPVSLPSSATGTFTNVAIATSATLILAASATRVAATVQNISNKIVYIGFTNLVTSSNGIWLYPGGTYKITQVNLYTGDLWGITNGSNVNVRVEEI